MRVAQLLTSAKITVFACRITSWRRVSVDDDRVDAVISHLEGVNTTLKSLRSQGGDLEPYQGSGEVSSHSVAGKQTKPIRRKG